MNSYNSSLTNTYSERQTLPLSRSEHTAISKENLSASESVREGQHLRGEIINRTTTDVTIRLSNGQTLQARLDVSVPLSIGQTASFEVTHADPALISLRILQDESAFAQNALIQKALTAAELPITDRNAELVNTLLQHNLPISKESILSLIRQSNTYPNADLNTLALLTQHKLPVTQVTLTQFEAYQNYEHQILPQLANLAHSLSELAASSDSSLSGLAQTLQNLLHPSSETVTGTVQNPEPGSPAPSINANATFTQVGANTLHDPQNQLPSAQLSSAEANATLTVGVPNPEAGLTQPSPPVDSPLIQSADTPVSNLQIPSLPAGTPQSEAGPTTPAQTTAQNMEADPTVPRTDSNSQFTQSANTPVAGTQGGFLPAQTPLVETNALLTRWTLSPSELTSSDKVKEFYQQLRKDLAELHSALTSEAAKHSADRKDNITGPLERLLSDTASAAAQLQDNLEFMNMLNRIFPYVQLPIRFSDKTAHGELYVYTNKEKLRHESGSISVLLHLDMEALGPTDIYLSLTGNNLSSRFYLNASEQESLFTEHLPELKEALADKGFDTSFELVSRKQEEDPVREFLNSHDSSGLSRFTFDCRA